MVEETTLPPGSVSVTVASGSSISDNVLFGLSLSVPTNSVPLTRSPAACAWTGTGETERSKGEQKDSGHKEMADRLQRS